MSRQPDRSRSRRIVLAVVLFAFIVAAPGDDDECGETSPVAVTGVLAAAGLLPRLVGVAGRALVLLAQPGKAFRPPCPAN
ncbi:hypothetical protein SK854_06575 [Lentzea sp. BCCO 10_0061]|uniref:Uncharacterized protein n=1 Tax=Lentzea sokolovensis TaxID=3095429 RepID=A0ABU4URH3_9PSEU|nr:hypothetical protein [Lentzea sp. BCCO 10_0061]MDX8141767.1 hypothetical protein [Lentzea sp. BCCO 10_0061]